MGDVRQADRLARLGTETAFAVSAEAAAFAQKGNTVYPFHLGDMNIKTPDNIIEATHRAMQDGRTGYCPSAGIPQLRDTLARDLNAARGTSYSAENVAIQPGGKPVIGKFLLTLMNPGDEVLYPNPGYPIYESQIEFNGGKAVPYRYVEGREGFELDMDGMERLITPRTRLLIVNNLHNPTGAESSHRELERVAELALKYNLQVLADEAYFDMRYDGRTESLTSFAGMEERSVILYTFSKKYAMTGWRLGAAIGPKAIVDTIAKLNVNDESCTNQFIQYGAVEALTGDQSGHHRIVKILRERRDKAVELANRIPGVRCLKPSATFYLYPNVTAAMKAAGTDDYQVFRRRVLEATGVSFCTRTHFGRSLDGEKERYIRFAYSGIDVDKIEIALKRFADFMKNPA
jgi:aspartate/methionine/tyrosine aminotransferase